MPIGIIFWLMMILALILTGFWGWTPANRLGAGAWLLWFIALCCLGWKVFGPAIQ